MNIFLHHRGAASSLRLCCSLLGLGNEPRGSGELALFLNAW
jgi:hypothetical protein